MSTFRMPIEYSPALSKQAVRYLVLGLCGDGFYLHAAAAIVGSLERALEASNDPCDRTNLMALVIEKARKAGRHDDVAEIKERFRRDYDCALPRVARTEADLAALC